MYNSDKAMIRINAKSLNVGFLERAIKDKRGLIKTVSNRSIILRTINYKIVGIHDISDPRYSVTEVLSGADEPTFSSQIHVHQNARF